MKKTLFVLSDDKVVVGPRVRAQAATSSAKKDVPEAMDTDNVTPAPKPANPQSLAAKLSANLALKRKASEPADQTVATDKSRPRR